MGLPNPNHRRTRRLAKRTPRRAGALPSLVQRAIVVALGTEVVLPLLLLLVMVPEPVTLAAPLAGPLAARLYGHSCGMDSFPLGARGLLTLSVLSITLCVRVKKPLALLPAAALWWPTWLFAAFLSVINTLE